MCDVISSAVGCLTKVSNGITAIDKLVSNELQTISDFLSGVIDGNSLQQITKSTKSLHSGNLIAISVRSMVSSMLLQALENSKQTDTRFGWWIEVYLRFPLSEKGVRRVMMMYFEFMAPMCLFWTSVSRREKHSYATTLSYYFHINNALLAEHRENGGSSTDDFSMLCYIRLAEVIDQMCGRRARSFYLPQAARSCPRLLTEPNMSIMSELLQEVPSASTNFLTERELSLSTGFGIKLPIWRYLLVFKMEDEMCCTGHVCGRTEEFAKMLIGLSQKIAQQYEDLAKFISFFPLKMSI